MFKWSVEAAHIFMCTLKFNFRQVCTGEWWAALVHTGNGHWSCLVSTYMTMLARYCTLQTTTVNYHQIRMPPHRGLYHKHQPPNSLTSIVVCHFYYFLESSKLFIRSGAIDHISTESMFRNFISYLIPTVHSWN